jgi:hypothetical protein
MLSDQFFDRIKRDGWSLRGLSLTAGQQQDFLRSAHRQFREGRQFTIGIDAWKRINAVARRQPAGAAQEGQEGKGRRPSRPPRK